MKTRYILYTLIVSIALLSGCAAKKKIVQPTPTTTEEKTDVVRIDTLSEKAVREALVKSGQTPKAIDSYIEELKKKEGTYVIEDYVPQPFIPGLAIQAQPTFTSLYAPKAQANIDYNGTKLSAKGAITILVDSIIIISVQPILGIELMRLEVTQSDVMLLDKMNRRYVLMNYDEVKAETGLPITFEDAQAIVMNRMFVVGRDQSYINEQTDTVTVNNKTTLKIADGKLNYTYSIDNSSLYLLSTSLTMLGKKETTKVTYSGHTTSVSGIVFPNTIDMSYTGGAQEGKVNISLQSITFNSKVNASRISLKSYNKTTLSTILSGK